MRKLKLLGYFYSLLLLIALSALPSKAIDVQIGSATTSSTTYPFIGNWGGEKNQFLFTASEIAANGGLVGFINSLSLKQVSNTATANTLTGFSVRFQNTTLSTMTAAVSDGWTTAYNGTWTLPTTAGWVNIPLQTPFMWDGSSNLLVEVCWAIGTTTRGGTTTFEYTATTANQFWYVYQDSQTSCAGITNTGYGTTNRPNILFDLTPATIPYINASPSSVAFGYVPLNTISAPQTILLSGNNYEPSSGNFEITPSEGFEVSVDNGTTWTSTMTTLAYVGNPIATPLPIKVRFLPTIDQTYTGTIAISGGGATRNINLTGTTLLIYCASNATSTSDQDIGNITIGSIDAPILNNGTATPLYSNAAANQTYSDFTATVPPVPLQGGQTYPISISIVNLGTYAYTSKINVYIDYNVNGVFDSPQELAFTVPATGNGNALTSDTWTGTFTVPYTVNWQTTGGPRMRVVVDESDVAPACGTYTWGETEDYLVQFSGPGPYLASNPTSLSFGYCAPNAISATKTIDVSGGYLEPTSGNYTITPTAGFEISTDGGTTWTSNTVTIAYTCTPFTATSNVKVRFVPTTEEASITGTLTIEGGTAIRTVELSGFSQLTYCVPTITGTTGLDIANITIGEFSNASQAIDPVLENSTSNQTYNDFKETAPVISVQANTVVPYTFNVITDATTASAGYLKVFADLNRNSIIDWATERVDSVYFTAANMTANNGVLNGNLTIPVNAFVGQNTLMRFVLSTTAAAGPCTSYANGEAEDYWVNFTAPAPFMTVTPATKAFGYVAPDSVSAGTPIALAAWSLVPAVGNITVTPSANFQVSLDSITWSSAPIQVPYTNSGATLTPARVYTRFDSPVILGFTVNGTLTISGGTAVDKVVTLTAENMQTYPASTVSTTSTTDVLDIAKVTLANVAFGDASVTPITGRTTAINKYTDNRLETLPIELRAGEAYTYTTNVYTSAAAMVACSLGVYIDYNADGDFADAGESVSTIAIPTTANGIATGTFTVPLTALRDVVNSPRIRFVLSSTTPSATSTTYTNGETEDYRVKFLAPNPYLAATPTSKTFTYTAPGTASASQDITVSALSLVPANGNLTVTPTQNFEISTDGGTTWSATPLTVAYTTTGTTVTVTPSVVKTRFNAPLALGLNFTGSLTVSGGSAANPAVVSLVADNMQAYPACTVIATSTTDTIDIAKVTLANLTFGEANVTPITGRTTAVNKYTDNRLAAPVLELNAGSTYQFTVNTMTSGTAMPLCSLGVYIDYNANGDFTATNETVATVAIPVANNGIYTGTFTVPTTAKIDTTNNPRIRFMLTTGTPSATSTTHLVGETEDYRVIIHPALPMTYVSTTTTQVGKPIIGAAAVNEQILNTKVVTNNTGNPLTLNSIVFNTNGTVPTSAIDTAKVYSTGASVTFATTTLVGEAIATPDGAMTFTPTTPLALVAGENNFWLAYNVAADAGTDAVLDAELTGLYISDAPTVNKVVTPQAPEGVSLVNRLKFDGTFPTTGTVFPINGWSNLGIVGTSSWRIVSAGSYPTIAAHSAPAIAELNSYLITAGNTIALISPAFSMNGADEPTTFSLWLNRHNYNTGAAGSTLKVLMNTAPNVTGATALNVVGYDNVTEINVRMDQGAITVPTAGWYQYTYQIPAGFTGATNYLIFQGISDYENNIQLDDIKFGIDANMVYKGTDTLNTSNYTFAIPSTNNLVNGFNVRTLGASVPYTLTDVKITPQNTTAVEDVVNAKVWYLGSTLTFNPATATLFGTVEPLTDGQMTIIRADGEEPLTLNEGNNYFAITYDIAASATDGNFVDVKLDSYTLSRDEVSNEIIVPNGNTWGNHELKGPMNGEYLIGGTPAATRWYPTLIEAVDEINTLGMNADVQFALAGDQTFTSAQLPSFAGIENIDGEFTLTVYPKDAARTITGNTTATGNGVLTIVGNSRIVIDGRINREGTGRDLTIVNLAEGTGIMMGYNATLGSVHNITINNVNFKGMVGTNSTANWGIKVVGNGNTDLNFSYNKFDRISNGISVAGSSTSYDTNVTISHNIFGNTVDADRLRRYGVQSSYTNNLTVSDNTFDGIGSVASLSIGNTAAIDFGAGVMNSIINSNDIRNIKNGYTSNYGAYGINFSSATGNTDNKIINNRISDINTYGAASSTTYNPFGIRILGGTNLKIYNNTVNMSGVNINTTSTMSAPLLITTAITGAEVKNNIFVNTMTGGTNNAYAMYVTSATTFTSINYNDYYTTSNVFNYMAGAKADLAAWQAATTQDANSIRQKVTFLSATDLHLSGASACNSNLNAPVISDQDVDMDGIVREATTKMGADEVTATLVVLEQPTPTIDKCITVGANNTIIIPGATFETPEYSDNIERPLIASDLNYSWTKNGEATTYTGVPLSVVYTTIPDASDVYQATVLETNTMLDATTVNLAQGPTVFTLSGTAALCPDATVGTNFTLTGSEAGVSYELMLGEELVGEALLGTGSELTFTNVLGVGTYHVNAFRVDNTACSAIMTGTATITAAPVATAFNVTGGGAICAGSTASKPIGLEASQGTVVYTLLLNGTPIEVTPVNGTGGAISFGTFTAPGTYTVKAVRGTCETIMTGSATITVAPLPTAFAVTGGGVGTSAIGLASSEADVTYTLLKDNAILTPSVTVVGTGSAVSFGTFTEAGTYTAKAARGTCETEMTGSAIVTAAPTGYTLSGTVKYANTAQTAMNNCTVIVKSGTTEVARTTTAANGSYTVTGLANGTYTIEVQTTKAVGGITATDALAMKRHIAGTALLTDLKLKAANINTTGGITATDVLPLRMRIVGQSSTSWRIANYVFYPTSVTITDADATLEIKSLCGGDVNGNFVPSSNN